MPTNINLTYNQSYLIDHFFLQVILKMKRAVKVYVLAQKSKDMQFKQNFQGISEINYFQLEEQIKTKIFVLIQVSFFEYAQSFTTHLANNNEYIQQQKQVMLERQNYKEFILDQGVLQTTIAECWGYKVNPKQYAYQPIKTLQQQTKVAVIEPLKQIIEVPISKKLQKIEQELLMLENQKKLARMTQQAKNNLVNGQQLAENECAAIKMMKQRIEEYNFIIDHRHIIQKNSQKVRKILGIKKTKAETLNQQIKQLKDRLPKSSFTEIIEINKKIAQLYRTYQKTLFQSKQTSQANHSMRITSPKRSMTKKSSTTFNSLKNSSKIQSIARTDKNIRIVAKQRSESFKKQKSKSNSVSIRDIVIMQQLKQSSQGDSFIGQNEILQDIHNTQPQSLILDYRGLKLQKKASQSFNRKRLYTVISKKCVNDEIKEKFNKTITQSFIPKQILQKGKALDKRLRQNEDVIDVWRQKIDQNKEKNHTVIQRLKPKAKKFKNSLKNTTRDFPPVQHEQSQQKIRIARQNLAFRMKQVRQEMNQKQKMFALIIKKKQSRFKRVPGTQIIQQNDPKEKAKKILGVVKTHTQNFLKSQNLRRKSTNQTDQPQWCIIQNQDDQSIYWSMCRNQKLNILLRKHK